MTELLPENQATHGAIRFLGVTFFIVAAALALGTIFGQVILNADLGGLLGGHSSRRPLPATAYAEMLPYFVASAILSATGWGLIKLRRWARYLAIFLAVGTLCVLAELASPFADIGTFFPDPIVLFLALTGIVVFPFMLIWAIALLIVLSKKSARSAFADQDR